MTKKSNHILIDYVNNKSKGLVPFKKDPRFTAEILKSLDKKIKELGDLKKNESSQLLTHHFEEGGSQVFLFIKKDISTFDLHTAVRKNISSFLNNKDGVCVYLKGLSKEHQKELIESILILSKLETWQMPVYGQRAKDVKPKTHVETEFISSVPNQKLKAMKHKSLCVADKNNLVRTLACMPASHLNPGEYKKIIHERSKKLKYKYEFIDVEKLEHLKAGGILAVLQADPKAQGGIAHLTYKPATKSAKKISLVGKGLCFDTGGYNVKTGGHMYTMHRDMTGSAVVLAIFEALVELKAPFEVHAFLALAENLISPTGYKPNEVVTAIDGTSIEVVDTDAEGRMVLCDTLAYSKKIDPHLILDFATLTGGAVYSIGTKRAAVFSNHNKAGELAVKVGEQTGERCWLFPIGEDYFENIKSDIADILQCSNARGVDHINAASFLSHFVGETPWVHVDLSCEENKGGLGLVSSDVTGFGVRWGLGFIEGYFKKEI